MCLVAMGPCGLFFHAVVGEEKTFSSTLLGSVLGALQIKVIKDRLTGEKGLFHMHMAVKPPKRC